MRFRLSEKFFSYISIIALVVQTFSPLTSIRLQQVYAQEITPTDAVTLTPSPSEESTPSPTSEVSPTVATSEEVSPTVFPTEELSPTASPEPTNTQENVTPSTQNSETPNPLSGVNSELSSPTPSIEVQPTPEVKGHVDTKVEHTDACFVNSLNGCVTTDKKDYTSNEVVLITGYGFSANTSYELIITSDSLNQTFAIQTDNKGSFSYSYQLDGTFREKYSLEIRDLSGQMLASATFFDPPQSGCNTDSAGANDEPGQKDLTKMCADYTNVPTSVNVSWNWDQIGWSGNNTGDGCSLFDTDGDGLANYSLCVVVKNSPATFDSKVLYSCGDGSAFKCTNPIAVAQSPNTSCNASVQATDPFPAGDSYPNDTVANCTVGLTDVGGAIAQLIDVCSYPSQQPNSDPSDCILFRPRSGKLEVQKVLQPNTDTGKFNLQIDSTTQATDVGDGGTTGEKVVDEGNHTVGEIAGTGTNLSNYTTGIVCRDVNGTGTIVAQGSNVGPLTVNVQDTQDIICVISNSLNQGTLRVIKNVVNDNGGAVTASSFTLHVTQSGTDVTGSPAAGSSTGTVYSLNQGSYVVSENTPPTGYTQTGFSGDCDSNGNVSVVAGVEKTCTITNNDVAPQLTVIKHVVNDNGGTKNASDFTLNVTGSNVSPASFSGSESGTTVSLNVGSYSVDENAVSGYTKSLSADCSGTIAVGQSKTCTVTNNDQSANIIVIKHVVNDNGGTKVASDFTMNVTGTNVSSPSFPGVESPGTTVTLNQGSYSVDEGVVSGYTKSLSADCAGTISIGQTKTCTVTNNDQAAHLIVIKNVINDNGGTAVASDFTLDSGGTNDTPDNFAGVGSPGTNVTLDAGSYNVTESGPSGYSASYSADCSGTISVGQTKTCTVTNNDQAAHLIIIKHVTNDNGGTALAFDFSMVVDASNASLSLFAGEEAPGTNVTLDAGSYEVSEVGVSGYSASFSADCTGTIANGATKTCTVTNNDQSSGLQGMKFEDENANGIKDLGDNGLSDWTIFLDSNDNGELDANETSTSTDGSGDYSFAGLSAGTYNVREVLQNGWTQSLPKNPDKYVVTLGNGDSITDKDFGNYQKAHIVVVKRVLNTDGDEILDTSTDFNFHVSSVSGEIGTAELTDDESKQFDVDPGTYDVNEDVDQNYTFAGCEAVYDNESVGTPVETGVRVFVDSDDTVTVTCNNRQKLATVTLNKNVIDFDGTDISDDQAFTISATGGLSDESISESTPAVYNVNPGTYTFTENAQTGYSLDSITGDDDADATNGVTFTLGSNGNAEATFVNRKNAPAKLTISKTNNKLGQNLSPGDNVDYSITLTATDGAVLSVVATDLLPDGFVYRSGSWSATKNGLPLVISEPTYHSPGRWMVGNMNDGDVVVLSYSADISGDKEPGLYKDMAWAFGCKENNADCTVDSSDAILASAVDPGKVSDNFVGTDINIVKQQQNTTSVNIERGEVLGVALPATGAKSFWLLIAGLFSFMGFMLLTLGFSMRKKWNLKNMKKYLASFLALLLISLFVTVGKADAANLSVRLEEPKSPTNVNTFKINFVALDILERSVTVKCLKKGPSDGGYSQFGGDIGLAAGGGTGNCQVDSSLMSNTGTYLFIATATAGGDSATSESEGIVSVDYNISGPGTPYDYKKEQVSLCEYKLTFRSADDGGKTVKIEIYRSDKTNFPIDDSTRISTVGVSSVNQLETFNNTVPDCGKTWYFAIRAYDSAGNGSGVIGDSAVTTTTTTTSTSTGGGGAIPVSNVVLPGGETLGKATGEEKASEKEKGAVKGEKAPSVTKSAEKKAGGIVGTLTKKENRFKVLGLIIIILAGVGYALFFKKEKQGSTK